MVSVSKIGGLGLKKLGGEKHLGGEAVV